MKFCFSLFISCFKVAITEFLRGLKMLQSFCSMNKLALVHLVNIYEGMANSHPDMPHIGAEITRLVERVTFTSAGKDISHMSEEIGNIFSATFYPQRKTHTLGPQELKRKYQSSMFVVSRRRKPKKNVTIQKIYTKNTKNKTKGWYLCWASCWPCSSHHLSFGGHVKCLRLACLGLDLFHFSWHFSGLAHVLVHWVQHVRMETRPDQFSFYCRD